MRTGRLFAAIVCVMSIASIVQAEVTKVTSIEGITEYRLPNGLKVLLFPDASKPTVTVNLTVFVGSRHEGYGEAGMAHLLEHMLFKGTPTHQDIPQLLKDRGAQFNGTTWLDRTNYYETLPASDDNLEFALKLESDRMVNSTIAAEELAKEFSVVRNEFERGENSPINVLWDRMVSAAFLWHNYGNSTIGNRADIERVPVENLRRFYRRYYQTDNALLVIAGKFDEKTALALTEKHFGALPRPERKLDPTYTVEPEQDGEKLVTLRRVGDVAAVGATWHIPAGAHPEYAAVDVLESMLTSEPAGRLYRKLVETRLASSVSGAAFALHDPGILLVIAEVNQGNEPQEVLTKMLDEVEGFAESEISEEDVQRARQKLLKQRELAAANSTQIAIELSEWSAQGDWRLYFLYRDRLEKIGVDDVRQVAKAYLTRNNRTAGMYLPTKESQRIRIPDTPALAGMIGDYKGRAAAVAGEVFDVSPTNILARTTTLVLNDGLKVSLLSKKTRGEAVQVRLTLRYGDEKSLQGLRTAAEFLPVMMTRGTKSLTRQQLQDQLDQNFASLSSTGQPGEATFSISTKRGNLPTVLKLLSEVLRSPSFPEDELTLLKNEAIAQLEQGQTEPQVLAQKEAMRTVSPYPAGHPLYEPTIAEELSLTKALTREQLALLYSEYLSAAHGELSIVGDFDPEPTLAALKPALEGWKAERSYARIQKRGDFELKAEDRAINTPDKANAMYFAATVFPLKDDHPDYPALLLGNNILGGGALAHRLGVRVRQKEGLSYGVASGLALSSVDQRSVFYIYAIANPENMPKAKVAIREELDRLLKDGVTEEELAAAKQGWLQSQAVGRGRDDSLARLLGDAAYAGRTLQYVADLETQIGDVTREQVHAAVKKYLTPDRIVVVTAGDFEKKK